MVQIKCAVKRALANRSACIACRAVVRPHSMPAQQIALMTFFHFVCLLLRIHIASASFSNYQHSRKYYRRIHLRARFLAAFFYFISSGVFFLLVGNFRLVEVDKQK